MDNEYSTEDQSYIENQVMEIWREVLNIEHVGKMDDFFKLGGSSLQFIQVLTRISDRYSIELPLDLLTEEPTVETVLQFLVQ